MARRKDHTPDELTALTLEAAERIVRAEGLTALSARRLAAEIGYTPGTLYNHFADLDEIVLRLNLRSLERLKDSLSTVADKEVDPRGRLHALADAYVTFARNEPHLWSALTTFRRSKPGPPPDWFVGEAQTLIAFLGDLLRPLAPELGPEDRQYQARRLWASIHGICALLAGGSIGRALIAPMDRIVHDLVDLQCDALERAGGLRAASVPAP